MRKLVLEVLKKRGYEVEAVDKRGKEGICIRRGKVSPVFYVDDLYGTPEEMADMMLKAYEKVKAPEICIEDIETWETAKDKIKLCVRKSGIDDDVPVVHWHDIEMYARFMNEDYSTVITKDLVKVYGVSFAEIIYKARENSTKDVSIMDLGDVIGDMLGIPGEKTGMYIARCNSGFHGASVICMENKIREFAEELGEDLYIFPSSIHEIILAPKRGLDVDDAAEIVMTINRTEVSDDDFLSDTVYEFKLGAETIEVAE